MYHIRKQTCVSTTALKEQIYIPSSILRAGDDVEIRTEAEAASQYTQGEALPCLRSGFLEAGGSSDCLKKDTEKARSCAAKAGNSFRTFGPITGFCRSYGYKTACEVMHTCTLRQKSWAG